MPIIDGVMTENTVRAGTARPRNELGVGALMPWAGKLWVHSYVAHEGHGAGLAWMDESLRLVRHPDAISGTFTNRMAHPPSDSIIIGPHVIDGDGNVRTVRELGAYRIADCCEHLTDPDRKVYVLSMEGPFFELDLESLELTLLANLTLEAGIWDTLPPGWEGKADQYLTPEWLATRGQPHFKSCHTANGKVYVTNNTYDERSFAGTDDSGRLLSWDGDRWAVVRKAAFNEVTGRANFGADVFATGWDRASAILMVHRGGTWQEYRLPKGSQTYEHFWQTEWPRIREVAHERYLMDASGIIYEFSAAAFGDQLWGIKPVCSHLRVIPDYCSYAGLLVLGDNQVSPVGNEWCVGEPQSNLRFCHLDDLWSWGKPTGWGGPWWDTTVDEGACAAPFLMTGFDKKVLHLHAREGATRVDVDVDFRGDGLYCTYASVDVAAGGYACHVFPDGLSAHWVRLRSHDAAVLTAQFHYT